MRYSFALIPIGFGMWLAHYSFHLFTSLRYDHPGDAAFRRRTMVGMCWAAHFCNALAAGRVADWIPHLEILMLDFGLLLSLYTAFRIAETDTTRTSQTLKVFAPWALLILLLFMCGIWILFQPMEMRGMLPALGQSMP